MLLLALFLALSVLGLAGYVRLAPDDPALWDQPLPELAYRPGVVKVPRGAVAFVPGEGRGLLRALLGRVEAEGGRLLAGSVDGGRMVWVVRSALWGFPDYITAEAGPEGLRLWSRQRYGSGDYGVNVARLRRWTEGL